MYHGVITTEWLLVSQIIGYTASTVIVVLLFVLVRRAARFEDSRPYALLLGSGLLWNAGHLAFTLAVARGWTFQSTIVRCAIAIAFAGAALSPAGALIVWQRTTDRRSTALGVPLVRVSLVAGVALALLMADHLFAERPLVPDSRLIWTLGAYHVAAFFACGALLFYRSHVTVAAARVAIGMTALGAFGVGVSVVLEKGLASALRHPDSKLLFEVVRQLSTHLMTLGGLFLFARFRFADVFIRQSLRIVAASLLGALCSVVFASQAAGGSSGFKVGAIALATGALLVAALIVSFVLVDRLIVALVDRWLFRQPDFPAALRRLRDALAADHSDASLQATTVALVRQTLDVSDARIDPIEDLPPATRDALLRDDAIDAEAAIPPLADDQPLALAVPVRTGGVVSHALVVAPSHSHPTLLARELELLRAAALSLGHRLDVVQRQRDEIERRTHEAHLRRQLADATLRALQAQVNPHFLFNTLNTIAHLIQDDPGRAEEMTLRLAEVFNHVLTRSERPFSSVAEEMEFLRTYLTIEEARFGDRLRVAFAIDPVVAHAEIPSLILQPAVENALKHGFARKIGPGHLTISAGVDDARLRLSVEDDGVGPGTQLPDASTANGSVRPAAPNGSERQTGGRGLRNIAERLHTLYADRASLHVSAGTRGGCVLTVSLPFQTHDQKPAD